MKVVGHRAVVEEPYRPLGKRFLHHVLEGLVIRLCFKQPPASRPTVDHVINEAAHSIPSSAWHRDGVSKANAARRETCKLQNLSTCWPQTTMIEMRPDPVVEKRIGVL